MKKLSLEISKEIKKQSKNSLKDDCYAIINKKLADIDKNIKQFEYQKSNMKTGAKLLSFYVQDLLDLAQLRAGTIKKNFECVNVNLPLREIL